MLSNPLLDYSAIRRAQNFGLTDRQIGEAAALADQGRMPLSEVLNRVEGGSAFSALAAQYGLSSQDADRRAPEYADLVERYLEAYRLTGTNFPEAFPSAPPTMRDAPFPPPGFGPQEPPRPGGRRGRGRRGGRGRHNQSR